MKILLIEDEDDLLQVLYKGLKKLNYSVDCAYDGQEGLDFYNMYEYDVIILDLNLHVINGLDVLKTIRLKDIKTKILILSALNNVQDRVKGLDMGTNDYLAKPFDFLELDARLRTLCRISYIQLKNNINCKKLNIDLSKRIILYNNHTINFTKKEYSILEYLLINKNKVIKSNQLIEHTWDSDSNLVPDTLKYHICSIKKKLKN